MKYKNKTILQTPGAKTWYTRYRDTTGQHYISGKTQQEVYKKLKMIMDKTRPALELPKMITLKIWIERWYKMYKSELRERSIIDLQKITSKIPTKMLNKNIKDFTSYEINEYISAISSARTSAKTFVIFNDIFDKAYKNDLITKNPLLNLKKPKYEPKERATLTIDEENQLLQKITTPEYYIYAVGVLQGLSPGELLALEYRDVNFEEMTISITKSIDEISNDTKVKNKYRYRTIPLFKQTYDIIKSINTNSSERFAKHSVNVTNDKLKNLLIGITNKKITLYNLRHTFVTRLQDNNIPEHIIQSWVGHSRGSKITKEVYTHVTKETEIKYINILNS